MYASDSNASCLWTRIITLLSPETLCEVRLPAKTQMYLLTPEPKASGYWLTGTV